MPDMSRSGLPGDVKEKIALKGVRRGSIMATGQEQMCATCDSVMTEIMSPDGNLVEGCLQCWQKNNYEGPVPMEAKKNAIYGDAAKTNAKIQARIQKAKDEEKGQQEDRFAELAKRLEDLKSKGPMKRAIHGMVKQIQSRGLSELELFNTIDTDGSGTLERGELMVALRKLGVKLLSVELDGILRAIDVDGNGTIDYQEFYFLIKSESDALMEGEPDQDDPRMLGFEPGEQVQIKVALWTESERQHRSGFEYCDGKPDVGTVMGPGSKPGTLLVKYNRNDSLVNFRPNHLRKMTQADLAKHSPDCVCHECLCPNDLGGDSDTDDHADYGF
eukprot:TRINITY_DN15528_c0_g1_i2.p1 TRINITY_DN15528_c0_g1~~TRINITY_DN15528_c0_g1_i2.p1  ORF type:complete len:330 (-),score=73.52 TRINITY_DN15528_c0_g1_i2:299-1288(-)